MQTRKAFAMPKKCSNTAEKIKKIQLISIADITEYLFTIGIFGPLIFQFNFTSLLLNAM